MTLFEIYYHDPWRTRSTYARQYITTSADDAAQWLLEHLDEWYGDDDQEIEDILDEYDVSLEQILHVTPPVNDALVVAFEGFKRAYEELLEKEN